MKKRLITFITMLIASILFGSVCFMSACDLVKKDDNSGGHTHVDLNGDGLCDEDGAAVEGSGGQQGDNPGGNPGDNPGGGQQAGGEITQGNLRITINYNRSGGYNGCDVWIWYDGADGKGYLFSTNSYGAYVSIDVPREAGQIGFLIRYNCSDPGGTTWGTASKDPDQDRFIVFDERFIEDNQIVVYTRSGDAKLYLSNDGGKTLNEMKLINLADMASFTQIKYSISPSTTVTKENLSITSSEGKKIGIASIQSNGTSGTITLSENLDPSEAYTLALEGYGTAAVVPNTWLTTKDFKDNYLYDGELGAIVSETNVTFRLWAPTTKSVTLNIYDSGTEGQGTPTTHPLTGGKQAQKGVWSISLPRADVLNKYYTYTVTNSAGTNEVVDPYAVSVGLNGKRGMILDMAETKFEGYNDTAKFTPKTAAQDGTFNFTDAEIWEIHVRDFSNMNTAQKAEYRGKYMAFTETDLTLNNVPVGVNYLKQLGITHVHLLPSFDYATVEEQASTAFNWGYDPLNYNAPEGSYSTNPADGSVRVKEFKAMVQSLHQNGIGVIMDVVYNHTSGLESNFQKIVPYYYYRFQGNGTPYNGSGCGNETASDREMFRKFMIDSVEHWMKDYNVDGFRFDLMGLHDVTTMQEIEKAVHAINPKALIYGEGWTGGTSGLNSAQQSVLTKLRVINGSVGGQSGNHTNGVAMFNDVIRDAIKGSTNGKDTGYATGAKDDSGTTKNIVFGLNGSVQNSTLGTRTSGWQAYNPTNVINYASAHDNLTLWDKIQMAYSGGTGSEANLKRNRLAASIVQLALGVPFMQAGEEMLRSKPNPNGTFNENSYNASDEVNNLKWASLANNSAQYKMMQYYSGLIGFRAAHPVLRSTTSNVISKNGSTPLVQGSLIQYQMSNGSDTLFVVFNAGTNATSVTLPAGTWDLYINGTTAQAATPIQSGITGSYNNIQGISCYVFVKR